MATRQRWQRAAIVAVLATAGCLDPNPKFTEPTLSGASESNSESSGVNSSSSDPTDAASTSQTTGGSATSDSSSGVTATTTTATTTQTTGAPGECGDGVVQFPEECDDGQANADDAACTSACTIAFCGDGLIYPGGMEYCDDVNDDPADGCVGCFIPHVCKEVRMFAPMAPTGIYLLDPDANGPSPLVPVYCDMDLKGGAWTRIERSPLGDAIGQALWVDVEVNYNDPTNDRYRMPRASLDGVVTHSNEIWIDCGGSDHLWVDGNVLFTGEDGPLDCYNISAVTYKEAQLGGFVLKDVELCTGFTGYNDSACPGVWRIDENEQMICGLTLAPWDPMMQEQVTIPSSDIFAVDPEVLDSMHDCHKYGAVRSILMR